MKHQKLDNLPVSQSLKMASPVRRNRPCVASLATIFRCSVALHPCCEPCFVCSHPDTHRSPPPTPPPPPSFFSPGVSGLGPVWCICDPLFTMSHAPRPLGTHVTLRWVSEEFWKADKIHAHGTEVCRFFSGGALHVLFSVNSAVLYSWVYGLSRILLYSGASFPFKVVS